MMVLKLIRGDLSLRAALMRQRVAEVQRIDKEILPQCSSGQAGQISVGADAPLVGRFRRYEITK